MVRAWSVTVCVIGKPVPFFVRTPAGSGEACPVTTRVKAEALEGVLGFRRENARRSGQSCRFTAESLPDQLKVQCKCRRVSV